MKIGLALTCIVSALAIGFTTGAAQNSGGSFPKRLSEVRSGMARTSVFAGLSSNYTFRKTLADQPDEDNAWWGVYSKTSDENAVIVFKNGKVEIISQYLAVQTGPEVSTFFNKLFQELSFRAPLVPDNQLDPALKNNPLNERQIPALVQMDELTGEMKRITLQLPGGNLQIILDSSKSMPTVTLEKVTF